MWCYRTLLLALRTLTLCALLDVIAAAKKPSVLKSLLVRGNHSNYNMQEYGKQQCGRQNAFCGITAAREGLASRRRMLLRRSARRTMAIVWRLGHPRVDHRSLAWKCPDRNVGNST